MNGWGFYSYHAPRGDPWYDFEAEWCSGEDRPDYLMAYPDPCRPIPPHPSEAVHEGSEDYCLLTLLKSHGKTPEINSLLTDRAAEKPLVELRFRALKAAAC
jgi:hypothetical protein